VKRGFRSLRNKFYFFKSIKEVRYSKNLIFYECLKCNSEIIGYKRTGKCKLVCSCGHSAKVYTGKNIHFRDGGSRYTKTIVDEKAERERNVKVRRAENFKKYLNSDLRNICNIVSNKRDITKQATYRHCRNLLKGVHYTEGYKKVLEHLQRFCELSSVSIRLIWEPMYDQRRLTSVNSSLHIIGTTYLLPLGSVMFYNVYLNPKFATNEKILIAAIAHELSHIYADHNNMIFRSSGDDRGDLEYSEQLTDLLGVVLGMGGLMYPNLGSKELFDTCYLTSQMNYEAYILWHSEYLSGKNKDIKTLVKCNQCSQKLRTPISKKRLRLTCPKCKKVFEYQSF